MKIGVIDYGVGNLRSIQKAFEHLGVQAIISGDLEQLMSCDKLVLPGVGAFAHCKQQLDDTFDDVTPLISTKSTLGICVGMQLMFDYSLEYGCTEGLGVIKGHVDRVASGSLPVPHTGWSPLFCNSGSDNPLLSGLPDRPFFYFNHSFSCYPSHGGSVIGTANYDGDFIAAVAEGNYYGIQFHPEKSGSVGLALLKNFYNFC